MSPVRLVEDDDTGCLVLVFMHAPSESGGDAKRWCWCGAKKMDAQMLARHFGRAQKGEDCRDE